MKYESTGNLVDDLDGRQQRENADSPYDSIEVVDDEGLLRAVFYIAAAAPTRDTWPAFTLEMLLHRQIQFREEGVASPMTDRAVALLRQRMGGPRALNLEN